MWHAIEGNPSVFERDPEKVHVRPVDLLHIVQARWWAEYILEDADRGRKLLCRIVAGACQVAHDKVPARAVGAVFELGPEVAKVAETEETALAGLGSCFFFFFFQRSVMSIDVTIKAINIMHALVCLYPREWEWELGGGGSLVYKYLPSQHTAPPLLERC